METSSYKEIQRRHVEESRNWPDLRAYAAEMLRRHEAKKASKSRGVSASKHVPAPRKTKSAMQEAGRSTASGSALVEDGKSIEQANRLFNNTAHERSARFVMQENAVCHAITDNGTSQSMRAPSHVPDAANCTAVEQVNPLATRANDGKGMDEASFQKLLAAIQNAHPVVSKPNAASAAPGPINSPFSYHANRHAKAITNPASRFASSTANGLKTPRHPSSLRNVTSPENQLSLEQTSVASGAITPISRPNMTWKGSILETRGRQNSLTKRSQGISGGVSKKSKPKAKVGTLKKRDAFCQKPQAFPKAGVGCLLCFTWRASSCPHLKTVQKSVFPVSRGNASGPVTPTAATGTANGLSPSTRLAADSGPRTLGVSKNGRIQKVQKGGNSRSDKKCTAVPMRQSRALELAHVNAAVLRNSSTQTIGIRALEKSVAGRAGIIPQMESTQPTCCNASEVMVASVDSPTLVAPEVELNASSGSSDIEDVLFEGMGPGFPGQYPLSMIGDLPPPEEFFYGT